MAAPTTIDDTPVDTGHQKLNNLEVGLNRLFMQRREAIRLMVMSVLTKHHALILSDTGQAKSRMVDMFFDGFDGSYFSHQASIDDKPHDYFGAVNIARLQSDGVIARNGAKFVQNARWAFIDEMFDAPDQILRTLLGILNERRYKENGEWVEVGLRTAVTAANYVRTNDVTLAVLDRILFNTVLPDVLSPEDYMRIDLLQRQDAYDQPVLPARISLEESAAMADAVSDVFVPAHIGFCKAHVTTQFRNKLPKPSSYSPRRAGWATRVMQANAFLDGRQVVTMDDLNVLHQTIPACMLLDNGKAVTDMRATVRSMTQKILADKVGYAQIRVIGAVIDKEDMPRNVAGDLAKKFDVSVPHSLQSHDIAPWLMQRFGEPRNEAIRKFRELT